MACEIQLKLPEVYQSKRKAVAILGKGTERWEQRRRATKAKMAVLLLRRPGEDRQSQCLRACGRAALSEEMQVEPAAKGLWIIWALRNLIFLVDGFVTPVM